MFDLLMSYFEMNNIIDINEKYTGEYDNNPYIYVSNSLETGFQRLSGDLLMIYVQNMINEQINILVTEEESTCVRMNYSVFENIGKHRHNYVEMIYVIEGELDFIIEDKYHRYGKGNFCIINQNVAHKEIVSGEYEALYFSLSSNYIKSLTGKKSKNKENDLLVDFIYRNLVYTTDIDFLELFPVKEDANEILHKLSKGLMVELLEKNDGYKDFVHGYIKRIIGRLQDYSLYNCSNIHYASSQSSDLFERTLAYLQNHRYKVDRNELAEALHYNGNYISEVFLTHTGVTLATYVRNLCLQEATKLLLNTNMSISQIVSQLHYENRTTFYKLFKDKYGMTPMDYRMNQDGGLRQDLLCDS